ncbi:hypothetical protein EUGRSUZ_A02409 [Eucalyptus grandis]|uniref:Uncharacterized protein n=2 Tax=Eucalyptus grandis TaxID=71139 RepID=A0A059DI55_EUCGR|nr:hypothetical protein EUGRSUZ_A02409 [Eucalyptus grandis]
MRRVLPPSKIIHFAALIALKKAMREFHYCLHTLSSIAPYLFLLFTVECGDAHYYYSSKAFASHAFNYNFFF